jgi:dipeptidyl aminopeptidase/acylaminoacyl peptidase
MHFRAAALGIAALVLAAALAAQNNFSLTVDNIMRGPGLVGHEPSLPRWSGDSQRIYFEWKQASDPVLQPRHTYVVGRDGSGLRRLTDEEAESAPPAGGEDSIDLSKTVYIRNGDIFVHDYTTGTTRRLTRTVDIESNPSFTRDGRRVSFTRANNLYTLALDSGVIEQLTDIRSAPQPGAPPARTTPTGEERRGTDSQEFLKKEERELLDVIRQRAAEREEQEARRKRENPRKPFTLQARQTVTHLALSPDEKIVIATLSEAAQSAKNSVVPNYVTEAAYTESIPSRTKVGDVAPRIRVALLGVEDGSVKWVDHGQKIQPAGPVRTEEATTEGSTETRTEAQRRPPEPQERPLSLQRPEWSADGTRAVLVARSADNKDRWVLALDAVTGATRVLAAMHDEAWVDGPGALTLGWMKNDRDVFFQSERDGYSHLYVVSYDGGEPRQLTSGPWEVLNTRLSHDKTRFYLTTNEGDPTVVHLYSMPSEGGPRTRITTAAGNHRTVLSRDEKWIADVHSYINRPPELYSLENRPGAALTKLTASPAQEFWSYPWHEIPIVHFTARDGARVPARLYKPANFQAGGPAVIFVHGAGYLQNVHRWWSQYSREYMFHHLLMERGYLVLDIDYRGSAGYGRDWRTGIYRHMGGKDLDDHVDAARWLIAQHGAGAQRIGIYGGSYGGFITLMAMFTQPDVFAAGAALRPVTDWAHYNNGYTSSILNTPQADAEAYRRSSPIYFAEGLKGALLICHGMVDVNVHFQDTVRLVQRLIELRKENWEVAVYPVEDHAFVQPTSWADEYKRILKLFETNLNRR